MSYFSRFKSQHNYRAWNWDYKRGKKLGRTEEKTRYCIEAGVLAANIHNTQPWEFKVSSNEIKLNPKWEYHLHEADPSGRNLLITLGCCITNIEVAAAYCRYRSQIKINGADIKHTSVRIVLQKNTPDKNLEDLCKHVVRRYSNKYPYEPIPISENKLMKLRCLKINEAVIELSHDQTVKKISAELTAAAIKVLAKQSFFAKELSTWLRPTNTKEFDGMPGFVAGLSTAQTIIGRVFFKYFPASLAILAIKDKKLILSSPVVGVITTKGISPTDFVNAGRLYQLMALTGTSLNIHTTIMHAVTENQITKEKLTHLFKVKKGENIQLFFRLGYSKVAEYHTPRRPLSFFLK